MVYILLNGISIGGRQSMGLRKLDNPEVPGDPWLSAMLADGRCRFDKPGTCTPLDEEMLANMPTVARVWRMTRHGPPDMHMNGSFNIFSDRVREKLEELEPGAHDFFPIKLLSEDGTKDYGMANLVHIHQKPNIIDHDQTLYSAEGIPGGAHAKKTNFNFKFIRKKSGNHTGNPLINFIPGGYDDLHLWRASVGDEEWHHVKEAGRYPGNLIYSDLLSKKFFVSDEFAAWMKAEKITGMKPIQVHEKPVEWYREKQNKGTYW